MRKNEEEEEGGEGKSAEEETNETDITPMYTAAGNRRNRYFNGLQCEYQIDIK